MSSVLARLGLGSGIVPKLGEVLPRLGMPAIRLRVPVWNGLLRAVPKKKTSHQKKRQRQLTGRKQVKPLRNINRCPACGNYKRAHTLCMHCVKELQGVFRRREGITGNNGYDQKLDPVDERILYPGKHESEEKKQLNRRHEYLYNRPRTLPVVPKAPKRKIQRPRA